jgi:transposase
MSICNLLYVGMDVHKDTVMVAVLPEGASEPTEVRRVANDPRKLRRFMDRLARGGEIRACYEASGAGYVLQRWLSDWGYHCDLAAPSLTPTRPGERRKHDKRDASDLARLYRAGELVLIRIPSEKEERVRDLVRCRETFQREVKKSQHYILKFLSRRGLVYRDSSHWTRRHLEWLAGLLSDRQLDEQDALVFGEYLALLQYKLGRRDELDRQIEELALSPAYVDAVGRLRCFRGLDTHSAMVLITEIGDFRRFESPRELMAYVGLVPSEESSGDRERRGSITKAGNSHCRHILVQGAWHYQHRPAVGAKLRKRQQGQPAAVIAHAWKAQHRLNKLFRRLTFRRPRQVAVVAVARELVGFVWGVMRDLEMQGDTALQHMA